MDDQPLVVVAAAIVADRRLLAARRTAPPTLAGWWELPGGKVQPGERDEAALMREIREELGVRVSLGAQVGEDWPLSSGVLRVWLTQVGEGEIPRPLEKHDALRWLTRDELGTVAWLPADVAPARAALDLALTPEG